MLDKIRDIVYVIEEKLRKFFFAVKEEAKLTIEEIKELFKWQ